MLSKIIGVLIITLALITLDHLNEREKKVVYRVCLIEYNYHSLEERLKTATNASKQRLVARQSELKTICTKQSKDHVSL